MRTRAVNLRKVAQVSDSARPHETREIRRPTPVRAPDDRRWDRARFALAAGWIVVLAALPFVGERNASWSDVRDLVTAGKVTEVRVSDELPDNATGFATVAVHWHHGPLSYVATVKQVRDDDSEDATSVDESSAVLHSAPSERLSALQPGLRLSRDASRFDENPTMLGFQVPMVFAFVPLVLVLLGLGVLIMGPRPWRATPWAWFWWLQNPVGTALFLVLSGPFPGLSPPRDPDRRLTGGWSFLLAAAVTSVTVSVWGVTLGF